MEATVINLSALLYDLADCCRERQPNITYLRA